ncbi:MAG TPA: polysaccharide deacetylase, partial [Xanthobacteraceae bacterium]
MKLLRNTVIRAGLEALYFSGAHFLLRPIFAGVGAIFMLHHVRPRREGEFQPNHH